MRLTFGPVCSLLSIKLVALFEILPFKSFKYVCLDRTINTLSTSYSLRELAIVGRYFSEAVALSAGPLNIFRGSSAVTLIQG